VGEAGMKVADVIEVAVRKRAHQAVRLMSPASALRCGRGWEGWILGYGAGSKLAQTMTFKGHRKRTRRVYRREKRPVKGNDKEII